MCIIVFYFNFVCSEIPWWSSKGYNGIWEVAEPSTGETGRGWNVPKRTRNAEGRNSKSQPKDFGGKF